MNNKLTPETMKGRDAKKLIVAVAELDFATMLKYCPEGIRGLTNLKDFELDLDYESDARYNFPAREDMGRKCLRKALKYIT